MVSLVPKMKGWLEARPKTRELAVHFTLKGAKIPWSTNMRAMALQIQAWLIKSREAILELLQQLKNFIIKRQAL